MKEQVRRRRRKGRRTTVIAIRFIILAVCIIVLCSIALTNTIARYRSEALASKDIEIAMYVFKEDHQTMSFKLDQMVPRAEPYQHTFSVTNSDSNNKIAQTSIDYDITIKTTTNLPLQYVLYKNQTPTSANPTNILPSAGTVQADTDGTYFKNFKTSTHPITGVYKLHSGTDVGAPIGANFVAMADGIVTTAKYSNAYGNMVMIDHRKQYCNFICTWF